MATRPGGGCAQHLPQLEEAQHQPAQPAAEGLQQQAHQGQAGGRPRGPASDWDRGMGTGTFCGCGAAAAAGPLGGLKQEIVGPGFMPRDIPSG